MYLGQYIRKRLLVVQTGISLEITLVLLEFKCPFKRKIAMNNIPHCYRDQIQTGLALSGERVNNGLFLRRPRSSGIIPYISFSTEGIFTRQKTKQLLRGEFI